MRFSGSNRRARGRIRLAVLVVFVLAALVAAAVVSPVKRLGMSVAAAGAPVSVKNFLQVNCWDRGRPARNEREARNEL